MTFSGVPRPRRYPPSLHGYGLSLEPWTADLVRQMAAWGERGFPYHPFDMGFLKHPTEAQHALARALEEGPHLHFVACEDGAAVGRVSVNLRDPAGLYLWSVHVPPEHEGRGICRRMLATLMEWLEHASPGNDFVLMTNTFAEHAHRAYAALGFRTSETRWHFDRQVAEALWRVTPAERDRIGAHIRFAGGQWEVRTYLMYRAPGTPMDTGQRRPAGSCERMPDGR